MKTTPALLALTLTLFLAACTSTRTTTPEERALASQILTTAETTILALQVAGKITPEDAVLASQQLAALRADVAASETNAVTFAEVYQRVVNFGLQWALRQQQ